MFTANVVRHEGCRSFASHGAARGAHRSDAPYHPFFRPARFVSFEFEFKCRQLSSAADVQWYMNRVMAVLIFVMAGVIAFKISERVPSLPMVNVRLPVMAATSSELAKGDFASRLCEIMAKADSRAADQVFGKAMFVWDMSRNAPPVAAGGSFCLSRRGATAK